METEEHTVIKTKRCLVMVMNKSSVVRTIKGFASSVAAPYRLAFKIPGVCNMKNTDAKHTAELIQAETL